MGAQTGAGRPQALVVDDEREVADAYALRLRDRCEVETAYDGASALETVEDSQIDVVLLDRHMPGLSGDEVLARLDDGGFQGRVIMVTAIDPDFDVLDMPFDDYLCKPVDREDVRSAVTHQCTILGYDILGEYFGVESKRRVIQAELPAAELDEHEEYQALRTRARTLRERARRLLGDRMDLLEEFDAIDRGNQ